METEQQHFQEAKGEVKAIGVELGREPASRKRCVETARVRGLATKDRLKEVAERLVVEKLVVSGVVGAEKEDNGVEGVVQSLVRDLKVDSDEKDIPLLLHPFRTSFLLRTGEVEVGRHCKHAHGFLMQYLQ